MHFPYISSTLPRKWKMSSTPQSEATVMPQYQQPPKATGKPPKSTRKLSSSTSKPSGPKRSSLLFRSVSFSEKSNNAVVMNGPFKVPPPVLPPATSATSIAIHRPPRPQDECLKCSSSTSASSPESNLSTFTRDWRSQSMVDLMRGVQSNPNSRGNSLTSSFRSSWSSKPKSIRSVSSSCDGINRIEGNRIKENPVVGLATIFSKNLRSNSWRNLQTIDRIETAEEEIGGMNRSHRLSQGAKKVTPPSVPGFNPRASGSSFGSDCSNEREDAISRLPQGYQANVVGYNNTDSVAYADRGSAFRSPGRDSPGDDSSASIVTVESTSSGGCRNSTTSLDSGRASNSNSNSTTTDSSFHSIHPIREHPYPVRGNSLGLPPPPVSHMGRMSSIGSVGSSSFRQSYHSSSSSLGSVERAEDSICALDIQEMTADGVPDHEILLAWLTDLHYEEYYDLFLSAGYDMPTISRMTPEDLTAIGIKKPNHRKRLKAEISKLNIPDGLPSFIPNTLEDWLHLIRLSEYGAQLRCQGYMSVEDVAQISIEDLEDVGLYKLGHQKRFLLAIKRIKDLKTGKRYGPGPPGNLKMSAQTNIYQTHDYRLPQQPQPMQQFHLPPQQQPQQQFHLLQQHQQQQPQQIHHDLGYPPRNVITSAAVVERVGVNGMSSFQQVSSHYGNTSFPLPPPSPALSSASFRPTYHPEIIRIESRPSSQMGGQLLPQRHNSISGCPPTPSPPPSPSPPTSLTMPQPMPPLPSYTRYQQTFAAPPTAPRGVTNGASWNGMMRSFDDGDIYRRGGDVINVGAAVVVHHPMNSANYSATGGGTLPRPKGMVKPRPVAKIVASTRDNISLSSTSLASDVDPKSMKMNSSFSPLHQPKKQPPMRSDSYEGQGNSECSLTDMESFPFANDNAGTIRMRSNGHGLILQEEDLQQQQQHLQQQQQQQLHLQNGSNMEDCSKTSSQSLPQRPSGLQRSAGDVLNDIGSMLADLTDELDAMLHMEAKQS